MGEEKIRRTLFGYHSARHGRPVLRAGAIHAMGIGFHRGGGAGRERAVEGARGLAGLFLLGAVITVLELPTALPYLGATGILAQSGLGFAAWFPVLLAYNAVFVLPPVVLAVAFLYLSERASARLVERLRRGARETTLWIYGLVGFYLLANGLSLAGVI